MNKEQRAATIARMRTNAHSDSERELADLLDGLNQLLTLQKIKAEEQAPAAAPEPPGVPKRIGRPPGKGVTSGIKKPKTGATTR